VTLDDGRTVEAGVVGTDILTDIAVLQINETALAVAAVCDSTDLRVGEWVVAIGNPLGLGISAKQGIVSRTGISIPIDEGQTLYDLIETSAAINPGNSGGPLVNMAGEVIGITSAKISQVGVEGLGYAISTCVAYPIIEELIRTGYVIRPLLGVQGLLTVEPSVASFFRLEVEEGVLIRGVVTDGPAEKAGLAAGDVISTFGDEEVATSEELRRAIHASQIGQSVKVSFWRGTTQHTVSVVLSESPPPE
ncbi:S1C family serine protease, partial [Chloroflexota bacterium]